MIWSFVDPWEQPLDQDTSFKESSDVRLLVQHLLGVCNLPSKRERERGGSELLVDPNDLWQMLKVTIVALIKKINKSYCGSITIVVH